MRKEHEDNSVELPEKKCLGFWKAKKIRVNSHSIPTWDYQVLEENTFPCIPVLELKRKIELIEDNFQFFGLKKVLWKELGLSEKVDASKIYGRFRIKEKKEVD